MPHIVTAGPAPAPSLPAECRRPGNLLKDLLQLRLQDEVGVPVAVGQPRLDTGQGPVDDGGAARPRCWSLSSMTLAS
jgi:hypothetical protein